MSQGHERLFGGMDWYLLHEYTSISWFCSSSQWGLKPRHPEQLMSEAAERGKKIVEEKQMGGRKRGDTRAKGGGYREEKEPENWCGARWPLSVQWCSEFSLWELHNSPPSSLSPSPAWQGAGTAWAGTRNVPNNSPKQQMWPMNRLATMQEGLEKRSWWLSLQLRRAQVFLVCFILPPRKGREVICMQIEDLSCNLKEERDVALIERNSADAKKPQTNSLNDTRSQKAGTVTSLRSMSKPQEY